MAQQQQQRTRRVLATALFLSELTVSSSAEILKKHFPCGSSTEAGSGGSVFLVTTLFLQLTEFTSCYLTTFSFVPFILISLIHRYFQRSFAGRIYLIYRYHVREVLLRMVSVCQQHLPRRHSASIQSNTCVSSLAQTFLSYCPALDVQPSADKGETQHSERPLAANGVGRSRLRQYSQFASKQCSLLA